MSNKTQLQENNEKLEEIKEFVNNLPTIKEEQEKTITASTSQVIVEPDEDKVLSKVTVEPTPSESKTVTPTTEGQTVIPSEGNLLSEVIVNGDENLTSENIVRGENIFGVEGNGSIGSVENLLVPTLGTTTNNGVTCTNNGNGTYTLNGTATATKYFKVCDITLSTTTTYKLVGSPSDASDDVFLDLEYGSAIYTEKGSGKIFTPSVSTLGLYIVVRSGATVSNLIFKPMLTTNLKATYKEFVCRVGGFTNLITPTMATTTTNGVTCTNNGDGTYTVNGTATADTNFILYSNSTADNLTYRVVGCPPNGGSTSTFRLRATYYNNTSAIYGNDYGTGLTISKNAYGYSIVIFINSGTTLSGEVFKPMVTTEWLPKYYDFVKASGTDLLNLFGMSKIETGSYTFASASTSSVTLTHSLGEIPKAVIVFETSGSGNRTSVIFYFRRSSGSDYYLIGYGTSSDRFVTGTSSYNTYATSTTFILPCYNSTYSFNAGNVYGYVLLA